MRQRVLEIIATAPDPASPYRWMTLPWDAEAAGADAHTLEAAYQALHPTALRGFLNANAHHLTPACFDKIMGVGRSAAFIAMEASTKRRSSCVASMYALVPL